MIASAALPISVERPEGYAVPDEAIEALALLLIEAAEAEPVSVADCRHLQWPAQEGNG